MQNLREAAQQALEYLEQHAIISGVPIRDALRAALNQERYVVTGNEFHGAPPEPYANWGDAIAAMINSGVIQGLRISSLAEDRSGDTGKTSDHFADAGKMVATINEMETVEPVAWRYTPSERLRDVVLTSDPSQARLAADYGCEVQPLYTAPPKREPLTEQELEPIRRRMMMEAYNAADDNDCERYNALNVMANDVLDMLLGGEK